jgi:hypothetical protein
MSQDSTVASLPGFLIEVEDPEDIGTLPAYCRLSEYHVSVKNEAVLAAFECWRSIKACQSGKNSFSVLNIELKPEEGGIAFFEFKASFSGSFEEALTKFCLEHSPELRSARLEGESVEE